MRNQDFLNRRLPGAVRASALCLTWTLYACLAAGIASAGNSWPPSLPATTGDRVQPVASFGDDDREDLPEELGALEGKIGMVYEDSTQTLCTAFCVAKNIVATAAHCLFQPKNGRFPDLDNVQFRLNYGTIQQQAGIYGRNTPFTKHSIAVGTTSFNNEPPLSAPRDWALVKLEKPVCSFGSLDVEPRSVNDLINESTKGRIFQVAYHWDYKHWQLAYSRPCEIEQDYDQITWQFIKKHFVDSQQLLLHKCDTGGASSGSPILYKDEFTKFPVVVAINVGTYTRTRILLRKGKIVRKLDPDIIANTGVNVQAFRHVIANLRDADLINSYEDMIRLQTELKARGLYSGDVDGQLGRGTRSAIIEFEQLVGLNPSGLASYSLLKLFGEPSVRPSHTLSNAPAETEIPPPLHQPQKTEVKALDVPLPAKRPPSSFTAKVLDLFSD